MAYKAGFQDHLTLFPKFKIVCENESHYGFINLRPKEEYQCNSGYTEIDRVFFALTGNRIKYIETTDRNGSGRYVYNRSKNLSLEHVDKKNFTKVALSTNSHKKALFFVTSKIPLTMTNSEIKENLGGFAEKFFTDNRGKAFKICGLETESGIFSGKDLLKKKHHHKYNPPRPEAQNSPIEKLFREELIRRGIKFKEQVKIDRLGMEFTRPDFYIEPARLIIYCDGTEFHKDTQRIIMDKQQDRFLQSKGYIVFRFSGSEIFSHVDVCVNEVIGLLKRNRKS